MAKFKMVKKLPAKTGDNDAIIKSPDFIDEINEVPENNRKTREGVSLSTSNFLRKIVNQIGLRYGNENFNYMTACKVSMYDGIPYSDTADLSAKIVVPMFKEDYPTIFEDYITTKIKDLGKDVKTIYYVGDDLFAEEAFRKNGIEEHKKDTNKDEDVV